MRLCDDIGEAYSRIDGTIENKIKKHNKEEKGLWICVTMEH